MIRRRDLARALRGKKPVADWVLFERTQDIAIADASHGKLDRRRERKALITMVVHVDDSRGRGTARIEVGSQERDAGDVVDHAVDLAVAAIGPGWKSVPAQAPAKVTLIDPAIGKREVNDIAQAITDSMKPVAGRTRVAREQVVVESRAGLNAKWEASEFEVDALVSDGNYSIPVRRSARREADLALANAIDAAKSDLALLVGAAPVKSGHCALVLDANAFLHDDLTGVWSVFAAQADAVLERQGLARYRIGAPIAPGADTVDEPLTITSNGALDFASRSAPLGDEGDAIRRFTIVERGIAKALGLSPREAALRGRDPNGGVRNLVVSPGTWDGAFGGTARTIEVRRLRALTIDAYTGEADLELAIAVDHQNGKKTPFTGGTIRLDLVVALSRARRAATTIHRGAYHGPVTLLVDDANLVV